jgi:hypothetical protein
VSFGVAVYLCELEAAYGNAFLHTVDADACGCGGVEVVGENVACYGCEVHGYYVTVNG